MTLKQMVANKLNQWEAGNAMYFCQIMQKGGTYEKVQYPTGLVMLRASIGAEAAEIKIQTAKQIRRSNWTIAC